MKQELVAFVDGLREAAQSYPEVGDLLVLLDEIIAVDVATGQARVIANAERMESLKAVLLAAQFVGLDRQLDGRKGRS